MTSCDPVIWHTGQAAQAGESISLDLQHDSEPAATRRYLVAVILHALSACMELTDVVSGIHTRYACRGHDQTEFFRISYSEVRYLSSMGKFLLPALC